MYIASILAVGIALAVLNRKRNPFGKDTTGRPKNIGITYKEHLSQSLATLTGFLRSNQETKWAEIIEGIRNDLGNPTTESQALAELRSKFGGMGSINDLAFADAKANAQCGHLLDAVFRDMKLYHGGEADRALWAKLEQEHKDDLPPRIKHAFRKE